MFLLCGETGDKEYERCLERTLVSPSPTKVIQLSDDIWYMVDQLGSEKTESEPLPCAILRVLSKLSLWYFDETVASEDGNGVDDWQSERLILSKDSSLFELLTVEFLCSALVILSWICLLIKCKYHFYCLLTNLLVWALSFKALFSNKIHWEVVLSSCFIRWLAIMPPTCVPYTKCWVDNNVWTLTWMLSGLFNGSAIRHLQTMSLTCKEYCCRGRSSKSTSAI